MENAHVRFVSRYETDWSSVFLDSKFDLSGIRVSRTYTHSSDTVLQESEDASRVFS